MKTIVWYRNDLRITDHPALSAAHSNGDVVPVFVLDDTLLNGIERSSNRNRFLIESLNDLKVSLKNRGSDLVILKGKPESVLLELARTIQADAIFYTIDYSPYGRRRDERMLKRATSEGYDFIGYPGRLIIDSLKNIQTKSGTAYKVFTPFYNSWLLADRRETLSAPVALSNIDASIVVGEIPTVESVTRDADLSPFVQRGGESAALARTNHFLGDESVDYYSAQNDMGANATSKLSSYLHFGCLSPRWLESQLGGSTSHVAFRRQLAWREFYNYILLRFPKTTRLEFQERYQGVVWSTDAERFDAWSTGKTGYPIVDAAMNQLKQEGWMHNRARLIVGSFLTKDLGIDWRMGERHFMKWLIDGDTANNTGNWQWIASVGVDPAPLFRRLYNPSLQQDRYDPEGTYVRKYLPEMKNVPSKHLGEPWKMSPLDQIEYGCTIGVDYPEPIVDHAIARKQAIEWYRRSAS